MTQMLARYFPRFVPPVLAVETEQQWMLLQHVGPWLLQDQPKLAVWSSVAASFARLQIASLPVLEQLLQRGGVDRRLHHLPQDIEDLLKERAFWSHISASAVRDVQQAVPFLHTCCSDLAQAPIPATLVHGDLHVTNIALSLDCSPVFLDWSDLCLAHPFFDAILFWRRTGLLKQERNVRQRLQEAYLTPWLVFASSSHLVEIVHLAEIVGCVHQLVSYRSMLGLEYQWQQKMRDGITYWVYTLLEYLKMRT